MSQEIKITMPDTTEEKVYSTLDARSKAKIIREWLKEHRAKDISFFDMEGTNALSEVVGVVSATSLRHGRSLADELLLMCKEQNFEYLRMEGYQTGLWILVDLNDVIVHIMQENERELYHLESLWSDAKALADDTAAE